MEAAILQDVLPFYHCSTDSLEGKFPGLLSLLVTYFAVGKDAGDDRLFEFFARLYGSLRIEAMWAVNVVWLHRRPTVAIPEPLLRTLRGLVADGTGRVQEVARWLLGRAEGR
jgi:hypothetical protein